MSFSSEIKEKLCSYNMKCPKCAAAELAGVLRTAYHEEEFKFTTENISVASRTAKDIEDVFGIKVKAVMGTRSNSIIIDDTYEQENIRSIIYGDVMPFDCCKASYVRGAFLGCGSISDPQKNYHMEFCIKDRLEAEFLENLVENAGVYPKLTTRKGSCVVYLKSCEEIADLLGYIGAPMAALELFNVQIEKEMRNNINRKVNCENANVDKTARAASKHLFAIEKIKGTGKWEKLPEVLKEIGELRLEYPEESLKELGARLQPPIGKSGVNHRLNRILKIADEIQTP